MEDTTGASGDVGALRAHSEVLEKKIDAIYISVERTRRYFLMTLILSVVLFVVPLIGLVFAVPVFLGTISEYANPSLLEGL